ncbi:MULTISPECIES: methylated-DNA--[protein]-cysteine S-methyltransferase [Methylomonas]|uniref:methylated-DNA--[protein]-cysteine S-methyltransferase n=2 Tax=Methylomonas TaxID=416 RepID=A0A126T321_9GAMM|nr:MULTISPECIES: methylated-DNA--[protein]-cysteine S-methyltransferase [Methylomonas]AMK76134.1 cysteine methyltransferase [Methylomonas denitrificans]OAH96080.1 cysteine methyltransferase [Methylomonas methanica]TCV81369.1 O-6-methylguanine DNA methyltransferase [Methylomonas methanica]
MNITISQNNTGKPDSQIRFTTGACQLGWLLVATKPSGICAIALGDDPDNLTTGFQNKFPDAKYIDSAPEFEHIFATLRKFIDMPEQGLALTLDTGGTPFQQRVWQALREIPVGATASYSDIARRIGSPNSARAVASACAANPLAIAIPCHRVLSIDGKLSGYRWGLERKAALLRREEMQHKSETPRQ